MRSTDTNCLGFIISRVCCPSSSWLTDFSSRSVVTDVWHANTPRRQAQTKVSLFKEVQIEAYQRPIGMTQISLHSCCLNQCRSLPQDNLSRKHYLTSRTSAKTTWAWRILTETSSSDLLPPSPPGPSNVVWKAVIQAPHGESDKRKPEEKAKHS